MKTLKHLILILTAIFLLNACSDDGDTCPSNNFITATINGEERQFVVNSWGIDLNPDGRGHTLQVAMTTGGFPSQDSYTLSFTLPYKKKGNNIVTEMYYSQWQNGTYIEGTFEPQELQTKVTTNKSSCISATFSGSATFEGTEIIITDGVLDHVYGDPFSS